MVAGDGLYQEFAFPVNLTSQAATCLPILAGLHSSIALLDIGARAAMNDFADSSCRSEESVLANLRLALTPGVGPRTRSALLERFGSAEEIFAAAPSQLRETPGVGAKVCERIIAAPSEIDAEAELALCREHRIALVTPDDEAYPRGLREIHDPPGLLFVRGELLPLDALSVAIVGTRHATTYGLRIAERLASGLAHAGFTIVSGLARGIDAAAHRGALNAGGRTIAVLGSGVLNVYPPEHVEFAADIADHGAVISESPPRAAPLAGTFPQRNRIITGLALGLVVVEAAERSGALISARHAMEQGREVFAVPGPVDSRASRGCHRLLRDGARLVESVEDVLDELGPLIEATPTEDGRTVHHPAELTLNEPEKQVLDAIQSQPTSIDQVVAVSGLPVPRVLATVSILEMRRLVRRVSGTLVVRL
jgi:DNA processing protein